MVAEKWGWVEARIVRTQKGSTAGEVWKFLLVLFLILYSNTVYGDLILSQKAWYKWLVSIKQGVFNIHY